VDSQGAAALRNDSRVKSVQLAPEISLIRPIAEVAASAPREITWGIRRMRVPELWAAGITGKGALIGHLDTGVDASHPTLEGALAAFAEFDLAANEVPRAKPRDSETHGTHTAATIVGRPVSRGAVGVAPQARLASAMVIEHGDVIGRIIAGLEWAVSKEVRVVSASLGLRGFNPAFQEVIDALRRLDILPVFAIGNDGPNTSRSPGNYDSVLSAGAMGEDETIPWFSGSNAFDRPHRALVPDLVAPGVGVLSAAPNGGWLESDGTSMAAPHVAGLAALLLQAKPDARAEDLENAILESCRLPNSMHKPRGNHGVPDAVAAYEALVGSALGAPRLSARPAKPPEGALATVLRRLFGTPRRPSDATSGRSAATPPKPSGARRLPAAKPTTRKSATGKAAGRAPAVGKSAVRKSAGKKASVMKPARAKPAVRKPRSGEAAVRHARARKPVR
jgi:subtilisin